MSSTDHIALSIELQQAITAEQAWHYSMVPKNVSDEKLEVYVGSSETADQFQDELEVLFGKQIVFETIESDVLRKTLGKYFRRSVATGKVVSVSSNQADGFLEQLIHEAKELGSSDIHIEIYEEKARIRIRIDGMLVERYTVNKTDYPALVNKIKIKANLDISEKRLPQDGRIMMEFGGRKLDIRVSILPTLHGEKIVMRLLSNDATNIDIEQLGMLPNQLEDYMEGARKPNGILLISGPTGSGKTTTLYATLKILNEEKRNIVTIEDPIEYTLEGINQVQLKESIGLTFAGALRSFLRQDPDIIMLGEIRDGETAQMAIRAALTGHLVLSTIHTNSAWGTVSRLIDMGVPPFLLASTLNTSVAQRLVRLLCPDCKSEEPFDASQFPKKYKPIRPVQTHGRPVGCEKCYYTGYRGRTAIYEIIPIDYELGDAIKNERFTITEELNERSVKSLSESAFELFEKRMTSIEEVYALLMDAF